jgi:voltage-gated potassium channel Kch
LATREGDPVPLQILLGSGLVLVTTIVHGGCTVALLEGLRALHVEHWVLRTRRARVVLVAVVVLLLFFAVLLEAAIWAATYLAVGALSSFGTALYFSTVTFTTLGYGDVVLNESWRLLGAFQAANGTMMFGWTTALIVALVQRVASREGRAAR